MDRLSLILLLLAIGCGPDSHHDDIIRESNCQPGQPAIVIAGQSNAALPVWEYQGDECLIIYSAPGRNMITFDHHDMMHWIELHENPIKLFVWFQGEADALDPGLAGMYPIHLDQTLSIVPWESCVTVINAPDRFYNCEIRCAQLERPCVIDTVDLPRQHDGIHLTYKSKVDYLDRIRVIAD
jgi:hypothetical protein